MKNKKIVLLIAIAIVVLAVAAFAAVHMVKVDEVEMTEVITVTEETAPDAQELADEEEMIEIMEIMGTITEITDEYVMIDAGEMGMIQANTSMDTLIEGVEELAVGQTAVILYDGKMTRSLPAQITALKIGVYEVKGTVTAIEEDRMTIDQGEAGETVLTLPESMPEIAVGDVITAYTTGVSTMSLPPQMNAIASVKYAFTESRNRPMVMIIGRFSVQIGKTVCLFSAICLNGLADKLGSALSVLVDVLFKAFICYVHLAEARQYLVCAVIIAGGDVILQCFHKSLRLGRIGAFAVLHACSKLGENSVHLAGEVVPLVLRIVLCLFCMLLVCVGVSPSGLGLVLVCLKLAVVECAHHIVSFHGVVYGADQSLQTLFFERQQMFLRLHGAQCIVIRG